MNSAKIPAVLCLLFVCAVSYTTTKYDLYYLSSEWYGTVCEDNDCKYVNRTDPTHFQRFNLHGMWPTYKEGHSGPEDCTSEKLQFDKFPVDLQKELLMKWSGCYAKTQIFLAHEWSKHGSCWNSPTQEFRSKFYHKMFPANWVNSYDSLAHQVEYFRTVLKLSDSHNVWHMLKEQGIVPGNDPIPLETFRKALQKAMNVEKFVIWCDPEKNLNKGKKYILEIRRCFDLNYKPMDCPDDLLLQNNCGKDEKTNVYYVPFP